MNKPSALRRALLVVGLSLATVCIPWHELAATVSDLDTQTVTANGNGVTTTYTIGFTFQDNDHVHVYLEDQTTTPYTRTEVLQGAGASKFTISGGDPGTSVVMGTAPASTERLIIKRVTPKTQTVDYVETDAFPAEDHESAMDKFALLLQEIQADVDTKVGLDDASTADVPVLPDPVANRFLIFNSAADDFSIAPSSASTIDSGDVLKWNGSAWADYALDSALTTLTNSLNSHIANVSNPHTVTAAQVGNSTAQWNANQINGVTVNNSSIANNFTLVYNGSQIVWQAQSLLPLTNGHLFVGDASNIPVDVALSGDASIINTGALTVTGIQGVPVDDSGISDGFVLQYDSGSGSIIYGAAPLAPSLTAAHIFVGNGSNVATDVAVTGDIAIDNAGVTSIGGGVIVNADVNGSAAIARSKLAAGTANDVVINDGSGVMSGVAPSTSGNVLTSNGTAWTSATPAAAPTQSYELSNVGLSASISSDTLVVALKQSDGSTDCSSGTAACKVGFRSTTATTGGYSQVSFTSSASITLSTTDSIGTVASVAFPLSIYLISDTTSEVCLSRSHFDDHTLQSASALTGGADTTSTVLWCTSAHTSKPVRKIGRVMATWSNPNWGSITEAAVNPADNGCIHKNATVDQCTERVRVATKCTSTPCTIESQSGGWSSVSRSAGGTYALNASAGVFSAVPTCTCTAHDTTGPAAYICYDLLGTSTATAVAIRTTNTAGSLNDSSFGVICTGPK